MFELEKIIHCWEAEVGRAFRVWFDSHNILVNKNALDTPDPLEPSFVTRVLRSSLGSFEVVSSRKETVFEEIFWKVLYHNGSERTVLNVINKCLGDKVLQRFLHMTVEYTLLGKYTHCNAHADFIIIQKIREQVQTSVFPSKIVFSRPVCFLQYALPKCHALYRRLFLKAHSTSPHHVCYA